MYNYMDSTGLFSSLYFPLVVLLGSFFMLNLFLAVIMETFSEMTEIQKQLENAKREAKDRKMRKLLAERAS
jgi:putative ribosome biogenesis GTPase RsgA